VPHRELAMNLPRLVGLPWLSGLTVVTALALAATAALSLVSPLPAGRPPALEWTARGSGLLTALALTVTMLIGFTTAWPGAFSAGGRVTAGRVRDAMSVAVLAIGAVHGVALAVIAAREQRPELLFAVISGLVGIAVALVIGSRRVRQGVRPFRWEFVRRAAYAVFVIALVHNAIAAPGVVQDAMRWLYLLTGLAVAGDGVVRVALGRSRQEDEVAAAVEANIPIALGEEVGSHKKVDLPTYLRKSIQVARDEREQVSVYFVDLTTLASFERSVQPAIDRIRARSRKRDFIAIDGTTLILVRRARFAARDQKVVSTQLHMLATPPDIEPGRRTGIRIGTASFPNDGLEPGKLVTKAAGAMCEEVREGGLAHAEGAVSRAVA
jgi:hypothetical protein